MEWMQNITVDDLEEPYLTIAIELGLDTAKQMARLFQGSQVYFPKIEKTCDPLRKEMIRKEFNGYNYKELADKYGYTERWIRIVVNDLIQRERNKPLENQLTLFETTPDIV